MTHQERELGISLDANAQHDGNVRPVPPQSAAARLARAIDTGSREMVVAAMIDLVGGDYGYKAHAKAADKLTASLNGGQPSPASTDAKGGTDAPFSALREVMGTDPHVVDRARSVLLGECLRVAEMAIRLASDSNWSDAPGNHQQAVDLLERCGNVCNAASLLDMQLRKAVARG